MSERRVNRYKSIMATLNFNTANQTFRQLLGNGLSYRVPRFQRDYSWGADEWDDLWQDIQQTMEPDGEPAHYMGYLVLQTRDNKTFDVIDGQQRLTTLSLLILAVLKRFQSFIDGGEEVENNQLRLTQFRNAYIGYLDPVTLISRNKLALNRNNDAYYKDYLAPLQPLPKRNLRTSEHSLRKAFEWFLAKIQEVGGNGLALAQFVDSLVDKLFFTVITVTDELNAFKVFETLNARGVRLSPTDLLKNYLFSVVDRETNHPTEIETLERRWEKIVGRLGDESFPNFLRVHWNSRHRFVREADLFKTIRADTPSKERTFALIREMEEDVDLYAGFSHPEDPIWTEAQRTYVRELRLFNVRQPWPLLLAANRAYGEAGFTDLLRACSIVTFRYNIIGERATNEQERIYNSIALRISSGELKQAGDTIRALAPLYLNDEAFRSAFIEKSIKTTTSRNTRLARYILFQIERQLNPVDYDMDSPLYTLEHILPQNPNEEWTSFTSKEVDEAIYRLGNLTLLEAGKNRRLQNTSFDHKKIVFGESQFEQTKRVAAEEVWNMTRLHARQQWLANQATAVWRVSQLHS